MEDRNGKSKYSKILLHTTTPKKKLKKKGNRISMRPTVRQRCTEGTVRNQLLAGRPAKKMLLQVRFTKWSSRGSLLFAHVSITPGISAMRNLLYFAKNRNITECGSAQIPTNSQSNTIFHRSLEKRLAARIRKAQFIIISDAICLTKQICSWFSDFSSVSFISQIESKTPGQLKKITGNRI
jgi:hypothetical protein